MKIWLKIALLMFVVSNVFIQLSIFIIEPAYESEIIDLYGQKAKGIAATAAALIDGDRYEQMQKLPPEEFQNSDIFKELRIKLRRAKHDLDIEEEIYTLTLADSDKAVFGVMTNENLFSGDTLHLQSQTARASLHKVYREDICVYTDLYDDQYGMWQSGIAPIRNSSGKVIAVVQADHESSKIYAHLDATRQGVLYMRLISVPILLLISIIISKFTTKPIVRVTETIKNISNGNYEAGKDIKASGELKELVSATDRMRMTIVEQQKKIFASIRELKEANEKLKIAKEKAEASDELKSEFLALISHEIRTPMNAILNYLEIIEEDYDAGSEPDIQEMFRAIHSENFRLTRTIDLIVNMAEMQTSTYEEFKEKVSIVEVIDNIVHEYENMAVSRQLDFEFTHDEAIPELTLDKYSAFLIFSNLIDNAVKFTDRGFVKINAHLDENNNVIVQVKDSGIGMEKEFLPKIFDNFAQEDHGYTRVYDGNGLGMSLVKKSCELNNAEIAISSEKGEGTEIVVTFRERMGLAHLGHESETEVI